MGTENCAENSAKRIWYAVKTLHCKEKQAADFFRERGFTTFIPMRYDVREMPDGKKTRIKVPAVHNLLFIEKVGTERYVLKQSDDCPVPIYFIRYPDTRRPCEIRDSEMVEFRAVCDPDYEGTLYVDAALAETKKGQHVRVIHGAFTGLEGKLVRHKGRFYVVVTIVSLGVMIHIPKWYCEKVEELG